MAKQDSGWGDIFWGFVCLAVAAGSFIVFSKLESDGGKVRIPAVILVAYKTLGKTGTAALFGGIGALLIVYGGTKIARGGTASEEDEMPPKDPDQGVP